MGNQKKEKVIVSACLLGENCKYNGGNNYSEKVARYLADKEVIAVCPEVMGGLPVPRPRVELIDKIAVNENGENVDAYFSAGVEAVRKKIENQEIAVAILQPRSPSCGATEIYDGSFSGKLISGEGKLAKILRQEGILVLDAADL
jgi:uncharacterized protein YbbK (DUF523 family)